MKIFFDTNVYVAEALLGRGAARMIAQTAAKRWRIYSSSYVVDELKEVILRLGFSARFATLSQARVRRRSLLVRVKTSRHAVLADPQDSPILQAAIAAAADFLVTNDKHLLALNPYEGLRIVSMSQYLNVLESGS